MGVTSDLYARISDHKERLDPRSFSYRYNLDKLVYFENFGYIEEAIEREKQLKSWSRKRKEALINTLNPNWKDLFNQI